MRMKNSSIIKNGTAIAFSTMPQLKEENFHQAVLSAIEKGGRIASFFQLEKRRLVCIIAHDTTSELELFSTEVTSSFSSFTPHIEMAHLFEREIFEESGLLPNGHPYLMPLRHPNDDNRVNHFLNVTGEGGHQVAVGPVHAGIIEPGHFRFSADGERVLNLEISLGYQHRGIEKELIGGPTTRTDHYMETFAGDSTIAHTTAYMMALEAISETTLSPRAFAIRAILLELERLANHVGDLGALSGDVGFLPTQSFCGRLRGDILNMTALITGNRFGRRAIRAGGVLFDIEEKRALELLNRLNIASNEVAGAIDLLWQTPSVMARFEETGKISMEEAKRFGLVGVAARASGLDRDVRRDFAHGFYCFSLLPTVICESGDVFARAYVRALEIERSFTFLFEILNDLPAGELIVPLQPLRPSMMTVTLVEGWRGEICHVAITDEKGTFRRYKVVDPSFHNWIALSLAIKNGQISDFPLCNKSFNLSYAGHDA